MSKSIDEILATYGNYKTVRNDWAENEQDDPFEITGGNKLLLEQAKRAILEAIKAEMPKPCKDVRGSIQNPDNPTHWTRHAKAYNQALSDVNVALDKMFAKESEE